MRIDRHCFILVGFEWYVRAIVASVDLDAVTLGRGCHDGRGPVVCAAELAAWVAAEPHSDHPTCLSPVLVTFLRTWNDDLPDDARQALKRSIDRAVRADSSGAADDRRIWALVDWLVRVHSPRWLAETRLDQEAAVLRTLAPVASLAASAAAELPLQTAIDAARRCWVSSVRPRRSVGPGRSAWRTRARAALRSSGARAALAAVEAGVRARVGTAVKETSRRAIRQAAASSRPSLREARLLARTTAHEVVRSHPLVAAGSVAGLAFTCGALAVWCGQDGGGPSPRLGREALDDAGDLWQVLVGVTS